MLPIVHANASSIILMRQMRLERINRRSSGPILDINFNVPPKILHNEAI